MEPKEISLRLRHVQTMLAVQEHMRHLSGVSTSLRRVITAVNAGKKDAAMRALAKVVAGMDAGTTVLEETFTRHAASMGYKPKRKAATNRKGK
jgi:hypothetical protein